MRDDLSSPAQPTAQHPKKRCLICGKESQKAYHPFCSKRCADIDLGRWLNEDYSLPAALTDEDLPLLNNDP